MEFKISSSRFASAHVPENQEAAPDVAASCFHCGTSCEGNGIVSEQKNFCCRGCRTVYTLLASNQLDGYYSVADAHPGQRAAEPGAYAWLDQDATAQKLLDYRDEKQARLRLRLPDMHCAACIWLLEQLYRIQPGITRSEVDFPRREIDLSYDPSRLSLRQVVELLDTLGYPPALSLADTTDGQKAPKDRKLWYALGIAGFCFGNVMLLSFPEYLSLTDPGLAVVFRWLAMVFSIPVVVYSARSYYTSAWKGLRHGMINMDVPIALGILVLFVRSSMDVVLGWGPGYFDSLSGLVFFLLIGRAYQRKTYHLLAFDRDYRSYFPIAATRLLGNDESTVGLSDLKAGDQVLVRNGELIPADARLLAGEARIDYSFVTGEAEAVKVAPEAVLHAGGRQRGGPIRMVLEKEVAEGYLTRLWTHDAFRKNKEAEVSRLSEKVARRFTPAVLLIALGAAVVWAFIDAGQIWNIVSAVLIVACPCALALSTPFTFGHILRVFGRKGLFLKGPAVVEQLAAVDMVVFDKTGTLTETRRSEVSFEGDELAGEDLVAMRSLLQGSVHPLSRRLFAELPPGPVRDLSDFREEKGKGLRAEVSGRRIWMGSREFVADGLETDDLPNEANKAVNSSLVYLRTDRHIRGRFVIKQAWRQGMEGLVHDLASEYRLGILSGDHDGARADLEDMMPSGSELRFRQSPGDKLDWIRKLQAAGNQVAMVGDGLNDAGALQQSDAGIALTDDLSAFTPASDAIVRGSVLHELPLFFSAARKGIRLIHISFVISFLYNLVGLGFAVTGHLSPLVAAILMPASSVSVVLFTTIGVRWIAFRVWRNVKSAEECVAEYSPEKHTPQPL